MSSMLARAVLMGWVLLAGCVNRSPVRVSAWELKAKGTATFNGQFQDVFDAAWVAIEHSGLKVETFDRLEGTFETEKQPITAPAGWGGEALRSERVDVFQSGNQVSVAVVPRLFAGDRDVSDDEVWVLGGSGGEEERWRALHERIGALLEEWKTVPEFVLDAPRGIVSVLGVHFRVPADWRGLELAVDRHQVVSQLLVHGQPGCAECPGGLNPTIVFDVTRRSPPGEAPNVVRVALEHALGLELAEPAAYATEASPLGTRGTGEVLAGDPAKTVSVAWHQFDLGHPVWLVRVAAACGASGPAGCDLPYSAMLDEVIGHHGQ